MGTRALCVAVSTSMLLPPASGLHNNLSLTPAMGFNNCALLPAATAAAAAASMHQQPSHLSQWHLLLLLLDSDTPPISARRQRRRDLAACLLAALVCAGDEMPLHYPPWAHGFNESEVKRVAAALVSTGMRALGCTLLPASATSHHHMAHESGPSSPNLGLCWPVADTFLNLDCGWSTGYRSKSGELQVNTTLFPSAAGGKGLAPLAAHLHSLNVSLGIYTSGQQCCGPKDRDDGSEGKEAQDSATFAVGVRARSTVRNTLRDSRPQW
jgi:hypothetical protein